MSWSVSAIGRPNAVKASLATQFDAAKKQTASIPEEQSGVAAIEQTVNAQLDFAASNGIGAIKVDASGSFSRESKAELRSYPGSCQTKLEIQSLYNFVE